MAYSDAESQALLDYLSVTNGNETREETIARLKAALQFAETRKAKATVARKPRRLKRR
jgi:hypothetical protein